MPTECIYRETLLQELRSLVYGKWGKTYDVRLLQRGGRTFLHIMWRFLEQQSFPLTEMEYMEQLDAIAELCRIWGVSDTVRNGIRSSDRAPVVTRGTGIPVQIVLGENLSMLETG